MFRLLFLLYRLANKPLTSPVSAQTGITLVASQASSSKQDTILPAANKFDTLLFFKILIGNSYHSPGLSNTPITPIESSCLLYKSSLDN